MQEVIIYNYFLYGRVSILNDLEKRKPIRETKMILTMISAENQLLKAVSENIVR